MSTTMSSSMKVPDYSQRSQNAVGVIKSEGAAWQAPASQMVLLGKHQHPRWCCLASINTPDGPAWQASAPQMVLLGKHQHPRWCCLASISAPDGAAR